MRKSEKRCNKIV